jgi:hypothetical protein
MIASGMIGRSYLESAISFQGCVTCFNLCGQSGCPLRLTLCRLPPSPVVVLARWGTGKGVIRNVAVRRASGEVVIRPFRGLRRVR